MDSKSSAAIDLTEQLNIALKLSPSSSGSGQNRNLPDISLGSTRYQETSGGRGKSLLKNTAVTVSNIAVGINPETARKDSTLSEPETSVTSPFCSTGTGVGRGRGLIKPMKDNQIGIPSPAQCANPVNASASIRELDNNENTGLDTEEFDFDKFEVTASHPFFNDEIPVRKERASRPVERVVEPGSSLRPSSVQQNLNSFRTLSPTGYTGPGGPPKSKKEQTTSKTPWKAILKGNDLLEPYNSLEDFPLKRRVENALKGWKVEPINSLQRCAWPHVFSGRNCFIVGGTSKRQGKTLAYLVPIAAKVMRDTEMHSQKPKYGPLGIVLCGSTNSGMNIENHLNTLFQQHRLTVYRGSISDSDFQVNLNKNPDFIVCQPDFLLFVTEKYSRFFGFGRLQYFVVDDSHVLFREDFGQTCQTRNVLQILSHDIERTERRAYPLQFVFCGPEWTETMEQALTLYDNPVVIVGSYLQAIVYGDVKIQVDLVDDEEKYEKVAELISTGGASMKYAVVVCQTRSSVVKVGVKLYRSNGILSKCLTDEDRTPAAMKKLRNEWENRFARESLVIVVTDEDLKELQLESVSTLVHFEMPIKKLPAFAERHICMWDLFPDLDRICDDSASGETGVKLTSYVFLAPDQPDLYKLVQQFKQINVNVPMELSEVADKLCNQELRSAIMCRGITLYGKCNALDKLNCGGRLRHFFTKESLEADSTIPKFKNGRVELRIIKCIDVNYYLAQVLNFYQVKNGAKIDNISYMNILKRRHDGLNKIFEMESNRTPLHNVSKDVMCAVEFTEGEYLGFTRAKIEEKINIETDGYAHFRVWCMDIGEHQIRSSNQLFLLPNEYERMSNIIVHVIIADIKPLGGEDQFQSTKKGFSGRAKDILQHQILTGRVSLSVEDTIWVKSLFDSKKDSNGEWIQRLNVRTEFLRKWAIAEDNPDHLASLYKLCADEGFDCGIYNAMEAIGKEFQGIRDPINWAFLQKSSPDEPKTTEVWSTFAVSPDKIYVNRSDYFKEMNELLDELNNTICSLIEEKHRDYGTKFSTHYEEGLCIAAKDVDGRWSRALIIGVHPPNNRSECSLFDVFFVDHGDSFRCLTPNEIFPIPRKFVERLPFQVIALRLSHVEPFNNQIEEDNEKNTQRIWTTETKEHLQGCLIRDEMSLSLNAMVLRKNNEAGGPLCEYYEAYLFQPESENLGVGEYLVAEQLATRTQALWEDFEKAKSILFNLPSAHCSQSQSEDDKPDETPDMEYFSRTLQNFDDDDDEFDVHVAEPLLNQLGIRRKDNQQIAVSPKVEIPAIVENPSSCTRNRETEIAPSGMNESGMKFPTVLWSQTIQNITLKICLADINDYQFKVEEDKRSLIFTSIDPPQYAFNIKTFAKVVSPPQETLLGQHLIIKIDKLTPSKWAKLQNTVAKVWWLKRDTERGLSSNEDTDEDAGASADHETNYFAHRSARSTGRTENIGASLGVDYNADSSDDEDLSETEDMTGVN